LASSQASPRVSQSVAIFCYRWWTCGSGELEIMAMHIIKKLHKCRITKPCS
jgi:hypothetical protein